MQRLYLSGDKMDVSGLQDISWHGLQLDEPSWSDSSSRVLACTLSRVEKQEEDLHIIFNLSDDELSMELPELKGRTWHLAVDTACPIYKDVFKPEQQQVIKGNTIQVGPNSIVVCESR